MIWTDEGGGGKEEGEREGERDWSGQLFGVDG